VNARHLTPMLLSSALLAGCASGWTEHYNRWASYVDADGPYTAWARCVGDRSRHYLDPEGPNGARARPGEAVAGTPAQLFTNVLGDCRLHMAGPGWANLTDRELQQLLADAHQAFFAAQAEINGRMDERVMN